MDKNKKVLALIHNIIKQLEKNTELNILIEHTCQITEVNQVFIEDLVKKLLTRINKKNKTNLYEYTLVKEKQKDLKELTTDVGFTHRIYRIEYPVYDKTIRLNFHLIEGPSLALFNRDNEVCFDLYTIIHDLMSLYSYSDVFNEKEITNIKGQKSGMVILM